MASEKTFPLTIADWREVFETRGAPGACEFFLRKLAGIDAATQRAALTALPAIPVLQRRFADSSETRGALLAGVPFLAKDLYATAGDATGAGSIFLGEILGLVARDAALVAHVRDAGAVLCGKTQLNEFALGMSGENPHFGDCPHPTRVGLLAGGSSSGSAWAVGAGLVPFALGSDTAGSIRVPAAFCGVWGLRLEPGLLDAEDLFPLSPSFDTPGWFAGSGEDMLRVTGALLGENFVSQKTAPASPRRLFIACADTVSPEVRAATTRFAGALGFVENAGAERFFSEIIGEIEKIYPVLGANEAAGVHAAWLDTFREKYDPVVWQRLDAGRRRTPEEIAAANVRRAAIISGFKKLFGDYDLIALPATPLPAQPKCAQTEALRAALLRLNAPASMAALPALALPVPLPGGLTTGLQIIFPSLAKMNLSAVL